MSFVYAGPSWAVSSYPQGLHETNLAKQWQIPYIDCSARGTNVLYGIEKIATSASQSLPVVWIYNEPLGCLKQATGLEYTDLLEHSDWRKVWNQCNHFCLEKISNLNRPVLLIGAHSDIVDCDYPNITVGHHSWQKFLAQTAGMLIDNSVYVKMDDGGNFSLDFCWGGEIMHRRMHENPNIAPSVEITNAIWDIFFFWKALEKANLFYNVHPNVQGNILFANHLKPIVKKFLEDTK